MEITSYKLRTKKGQVVSVLGLQEKGGTKLMINGKEICSVKAHRHDLDNIQREFLKQDLDLKETVNQQREISPSDVIEGLENIMEKYPETKGRLASLKSQIKNVFVKYNVLD